jgi:DNA-binding transcriptional ArsR family regulator
MKILLVIVVIAAILLLLLIIVVSLINLIVRAQVRKVDFLRAVDSDKFKDSHEVLATLKDKCSLLSITHVSIALAKLKQENLIELEKCLDDDDDEDTLHYYFRINEAGRAYLREHSSS